MKELLAGLLLLGSITAFADDKCTNLEQVAGTYKYEEHQIVLTVDGCNLYGLGDNDPQSFDGVEREINGNLLHGKIETIKNDSLVNKGLSIVIDMPILKIRYSNTDLDGVMYNYDENGNKYYVRKNITVMTLKESGALEISNQAFDDNDNMVNEFTFEAEKH